MRRSLGSCLGSVCLIVGFSIGVCSCEDAIPKQAPVLRQLPEEVARADAIYRRAKKSAQEQVTAENADERLDEIEHDIRVELEVLR